jgi:predicted HicB family RNase H-like nuclease
MDETKKTTGEFWQDGYPVEIHRVVSEGENPYFMAFLPDFGEAACSAVGDTAEEALEELQYVKKDVEEYYRINGKELPKASRLPSQSQSLQQMPLRVPQNIHEKIKACAAREGSSLNSYVVRLLIEHLALRTVERKVDELFAETFEKWMTIGPVTISPVKVVQPSRNAASNTVVVYPDPPGWQMTENCLQQETGS